MLVPGAKVSTEEVLARWAFSESRSARWARNYPGITSAAQSEDLTPAEKTALVNALTAHRQGFVADVRQYAEYELQDWTKAQLGRAYTVPRMAPDRNSFACPRFLEESDPRVQADRITFNTPFDPEPITGHARRLQGGSPRSARTRSTACPS
jgi:hypothetical protein